MESLDAAYQQFATIKAEISQYVDTLYTEQDTRIKVIDRILVDVLGWPLSAISTEARSGAGFIDYKLSINLCARAIIEAKRDSRSLGFANLGSARAYRLDGAAFKKEPDCDEGIEQAISYCGRKNAELAVVTNGREWLIFRGSRAGDGMDSRAGCGFVFSSLEEVYAHFKLFYDLLSYPKVTQYAFRAHFQEAEGNRIRKSDFRKSLRNSSAPSLIPADPLSADLDKVLKSFFRRLTGDDDPDLLEKCFVITKESQRAEARLARIAEELAGRIKTLDTDKGTGLTQVIDRVSTTQKNEFVVLVGTKGAGKTTFIDRFFRTVLPRQLANVCVVVKVNVADSDGDSATLTTWLNTTLLAKVEDALFHEAPPTFEEIRGMFWGLYCRLREGPGKPLYKKDKQAFDIDFGKEIERLRHEDPHQYVCHLIRHIVRSRKKIPCLIFDNTDHFTVEFQERVFQYARSIYEKELALVILPITDRTSWHLAQHGAVESFENEILYLPTPSPKRVIERRIAFLQERIEQEPKQAGRGYFFSKGITLSIENISGFAAALEKIFIETPNVGRVIDSLANRDIRKCLELACTIASSPYIEVKELLKAYVAGSALGVPPHKIKRATIKGNFDIYPEDQSKFVRNVFKTNDESESSPLLGLRLLQFLSDARRGKGQAFIEIEQLLRYFDAMHFERSTVMAWLDEFLGSGLCFAYDPTHVSIQDVDRLRLSPSGFQHLYWGLTDTTYIQIMMEVTPLLDAEAYSQLADLQQQRRQDVWRQELELFIKYLINQDDMHVMVPDHVAYRGQQKLPRRLQTTLDETLGRH